MEAITRRELEIAHRISLGDSEKDMSNRLFISTDTVKTHKKNLFRKIGARNIADVTRWYICDKCKGKHPEKVLLFILALLGSILFKEELLQIIEQAATMLKSVMP